MIVDVCELGAVGDGKTDDTTTIQKAIDQCGQQDGGKVVVPPGVFRVSTLYMKSGVELHLATGAKLQGGGSPDDYDDFEADGFNGEYSPEKANKVLIAASHCENVAITGCGEINIPGRAFYSDIREDGKFYEKPSIPRPRMVMFFRCSGVRFEDASFIDSPNWTFWLIGCERVRIHGIRVIGDQMMINNDGIDLDSCRDVFLGDCLLKTGDDCLILRAIQTVQDKPAVCENVVVSDCVLDSACNGVRVGCPGDNVIRNCVFSNIVFNGEGNGVRMDNPKNYLRDNAETTLDLKNVSFSNFVINSGRRPICVSVEDGLKLKRISNLSFSNIRANGKMPCHIQGSRETVIEEVSLSDVHIKIEGANGLICENCRGVRMNNVVVNSVPNPS